MQGPRVGSGIDPQKSYFGDKIGEAVHCTQDSKGWPALRTCRPDAQPRGVRVRHTRPGWLREHVTNEGLENTCFLLRVLLVLDLSDSYYFTICTFMKTLLPA